MSGWLGFRSAEASTEPQPFELICECNVRHSGLRKKSHQRIVCRTCGASLFVLPRDVYPPPPDAERIKKKPKSKSPRAEEGGEPAPVRVSRHKRRREEVGSGSNPLATAASLSSSAFLTAASATGRAARATVRGASTASVNAARGFWGFWTPLRLAAVGVVVLATAFTLWTIRTRRIERAEQGLNQSIEAGLAALQAGDISTAAPHLQSAVAALDLLDRYDEYSRSVRQAAREATALQRLTTEPLLGLLEQGEEYVRKATARRPAAKPDDPDAEPPPPLDADWANRFDALYAAGWVVLEAPVRRLKPTQDEPRRFQVDFPIGIGVDQRPVELRADFEVFDSLNIGDKPHTVIFGGQLESCRYDEQRQAWKVTLAPESGFAWVNLPTYRRLGFVFTEWHRQEEIERLLADQAQALGTKALVEEAPIDAPTLPPGGVQP